MPGRGSPPGQTMRHWRPSEDQLLLRLAPAKDSGVMPRWPTIGAEFNRLTVEAPRPAKAVRNRFLRLNSGARIRNAGKAKNVCKICFQLKLGHVCPGAPPPPRVVATASDDDDANDAPPAAHPVVAVWAEPVGP